MFSFITCGMTIPTVLDIHGPVVAESALQGSKLDVPVEEGSAQVAPGAGEFAHAIDALVVPAASRFISSMVPEAR